MNVRSLQDKEVFLHVVQKIYITIINLILHFSLWLMKFWLQFVKINKKSFAPVEKKFLVMFTRSRFSINLELRNYEFIDLEFNFDCLILPWNVQVKLYEFLPNFLLRKITLVYTIQSRRFLYRWEQIQWEELFEGFEAPKNHTNLAIFSCNK